jgi:hypothetical protein
LNWLTQSSGRHTPLASQNSPDAHGPLSPQPVLKAPMPPGPKKPPAIGGIGGIIMMGAVAWPDHQGMPVDGNQERKLGKAEAPPESDHCGIGAHTGANSWASYALPLTSSESSSESSLLLLLSAAAACQVLATAGS